ncbi:MAG TPA: YbjN domain-containing protein [Kiloniellales bacterium]|nr:YbjN domain-containing protein [Kiloniellales bacterium]
MSLLAETTALSHNPLDLFEELASENDLIHDRSSESELVVQLTGKWSDYHICAVWQADTGAMYLSCQIDSRIPPNRKAAIYELLARVNEKLWLGHFEYAAEEGVVIFRHTIPLRGTVGASVEQLEDLTETALDECERLFPALQLVIWGGQSVDEALEATLMETVGEA